MKAYSKMKTKCRGKTINSSLSSFPTSMITHLCPISWLSKFKQKVGDLEGNNNPAKKKQRSKLDFPTPNSSLPECWREARFYSVDDDDDDAYWRLSFSHCRRSACGGNTLWSESDDEFQVSYSSYKCLSEVPRRGENQKFNEMNSDKKKVKETQHKKSISQVTKDMKERRSRKPRSRVARKKEDERILEDEEFKVKRGKGEFQGRKMRQKQERAHSSKTELRIRVVEDMKKARKKMTKSKKTEEQKTRSRTVFHSFAMVKNSFNPQRDFRDSMVEMITEKGIRWREELEELLAAYLTLNCDEYHDLIIKVFQQVWFDVNSSV